MTKVLYITANPNEESQSYGLRVGRAFIDTYKEVNPDDKVIHLDLYKENIPQIDLDIFHGWGKLQSGKNFDDLSDVEKAKVSRHSELCDQFISADKFIFVTPLWNLSFPPIFKAYIDAISVAGKTFKYTEEGPIGLLTDKKGLHIQANGGVYSTGPASGLEMSHRYLQALMNFYGVPSFEGLFVEGHANMPDKADEILQDAIARAKDKAHTF